MAPGRVICSLFEVVKTEWGQMSLSETRRRHRFTIRGVKKEVGAVVVICHLSTYSVHYSMCLVRGGGSGGHLSSVVVIGTLFVVFCNRWG